MSGVTDSVFDEINGVRFIDTILDAMNTEKEESGITISTLTREALLALNELSGDRKFSKDFGYSRLSLSSIKNYIEIFDPAVNHPSLVRMIRVADDLSVKLKNGGLKKP